MNWDTWYSLQREQVHVYVNTLFTAVMWLELAGSVLTQQELWCNFCFSFFSLSLSLGWSEAKPSAAKSKRQVTMTVEVEPVARSRTLEKCPAWKQSARVLNGLDKGHEDQVAVKNSQLKSWLWRSIASVYYHCSLFSFYFLHRSYRDSRNVLR